MVFNILLILEVGQRTDAGIRKYVHGFVYLVSLLPLLFVSVLTQKQQASPMACVVSVLTQKQQASPMARLNVLLGSNTLRTILPCYKM